MRAESTVRMGLTKGEGRLERRLRRGGVAAAETQTVEVGRRRDGGR